MEGGASDAHRGRWPFALYAPQVRANPLFRAARQALVMDLGDVGARLLGIFFILGLGRLLPAGAVRSVGR